MCSLYHQAGVFLSSQAWHTLGHGGDEAAAVAQALHLHLGGGRRLLDGLHHLGLREQVFAQWGTEA